MYNEDPYQQIRYALERIVTQHSTEHRSQFDECKKDYQAIQNMFMKFKIQQQIIDKRVTRLEAMMREFHPNEVEEFDKREEY